MTEPTVGRTVLYIVGNSDLEHFAQLIPGATVIKAAQGEDPAESFISSPGNPIRVGDLLPMVVTNVFHQPGKYTKGTSCLNGKVEIDGPSGAVWVTSRHEGTGVGDGGTWVWPTIAPRAPAPAREA